MKYHWIDYSHNDKNIKLSIPKNTETLAPVEKVNYSQNSNFLASSNTEDNKIEPQIIKGDARPSSLVVNMTKAQVIKSCTQLLTRQSKKADLLELAIGNCVISNYQDPIRNVKVEGNATVNELTSKQALLRKRDRLKTCQQSLVATEYSNEIERQLLLGICISEE